MRPNTFLIPYFPLAPILPYSKGTELAPIPGNKVCPCASSPGLKGRAVRSEAADVCPNCRHHSRHTMRAVLGPERMHSSLRCIPMHSLRIRLYAKPHDKVYAEEILFSGTRFYDDSGDNV